MGKKEIVQEVLDWDQGIVSTFLTLFSDPKKVVTNPDKFTKPWKYATYVVSISCLFTWFFIHSFVDAQDPKSFWIVPKRMLELLTGYQSFYENTQPLKRLVLGAAAFYVALTVFLFKERKQSPGFVTISLYLMGHSVFITFILQTVGVVFVRKWNDNTIVIISVISHLLYLSYATIRILDHLRWPTIIWKGIGIFLIQYTLYNGTSTRLLHNVYFGILHRSEMIFRMQPDTNIHYHEEVSTPPENKRNASDEFRKEVTFDSLKIVIECYHPSKQEVARITLSCFSKSNQLWSTVVFEKINRYSPNPDEVLLRVDSATRTAFAFYRIANDSNATIQMTAIDIASGRQNYTASLQPRADDTHITDVAIDSSFVYLSGSTQNKFDNFDLGMIAKIDKRTGKVSVRQLGSTAFASWTSVQRVSLLPHQVKLLVKRDYKWMFLFNKTSWSVWTIDKKAL